MVKMIQPSMGGGEVSPPIGARVDLAKRAVAVELAENFVATFTGSMENRAGQQFVAQCKPGAGPHRIIEFEFNSTQTFVLELGNLYMRFHALGAQILNSALVKTITAATAANPVVITSNAHGLSNGTEVYITGVAGMTQLNGRNFKITGVATNTFQLTNLNGVSVDGTAYTAYTSGGTATPPYEVATPWASADIARLRYAQSGDVMTLVHPSYTPRELIRISNDNWSLGTLTLTSNPFAAGANAQPSTVGFYQQRRIFANSNNEPNRFWMSQLGNFDDFSAAAPPLSDEAITQSISARRINEIQHIVPLSDLVFLTSGGEYRVQAGQELVITPTTLTIAPQSYYGATPLRPIVAGDVALYCTPGEFVRDLGFEISSNKFVGRDISVLARHLFDRRVIVDWDYAPAPNAMGFLVMDDGNGLFLTYQPDQDIYAWTRSTTKGEYKSTCVVREGNADIIYVTVERVIDGATVSMIERLEERQFSTLSDAFHVDCGLTFDNPKTITNVTATDPVVITAPGHGLSNGDTVDLSDILEFSSSTNQGSALSTNYNGTGFVVSAATATTFALQIEGADYDGTGFGSYSSGGFARKAVTTINGLWHLENEPIIVAANGYVQRELVVSGGSITLQAPASRIHIGISYFSRLRTLPLSSYGSSGGDMQGRSQNITRLTVQVDRALGMWFGPDVNTMREARFGLPALYGQPLEMVTDDIDVTMSANWGKKKQVVIEQRDPLPLTVLTLIPDAIVGGN